MCTLIPWTALAAIIWLTRTPGWQHAPHGQQVAQVAGIIAIALVARFALGITRGRQA